ncbi:MAG: dephospho-CoA kinase [Balneolaceae bacterium]
MIRVGVTGGIGSGKTTFCRKWEELGAFVIYADDLAKELMISDEEVVLSIKKTFGADAYFRDGSLNRSFLAKEAFENGRVDELNTIVHPILWKRVYDLSNKKEKDGIKIFVQEAAILLQNGRPKQLDYVILVLADENTRIKRAISRDHSNSKKIKERIQNQPDFNTKIKLVDFIVENNGSIKELEKKAEQIFKLIQ